MDRPEKIRLDGIHKVFGADPDAAMRLVCEGVSKDEIFARTGQTVGVRDASFSVGDGEIFVVMGLSGSGKSTLVRMINRLIDPTTGTIHIDDRDLTAMSDRDLTAIRRDEMGMVFQHFALFPHKTVIENVEFGLKIRGVGGRERHSAAERALDQVGLRAQAESLPSELSGGMQQRVGIARALAADASLLLMDEPFSALDPLIRRDMQRELLQLESESERTIVFITHDLHEALILGDRIAIMRDGAIVQIGTGEEIVAHPADDYVAAFCQDIDRSRVFKAATVMVDGGALKAASVDLTQARETMRNRRRRGVYVVDEAGRPVGLIARRDLDRKGTEAGRDEVMRRKFPRCSADDQLIDIYEICAAGLPIAVTDDDDRLIGVVEPLDVFAQIADGTPNGNSRHAQAAAGGRR